MLGQKRKQPNKKTPSAKKQKINPIKRAQLSGKRAAMNGCPRPTIELLIQRNHYEQAQATAYLTSFDKHVGDENEQGIRRAETAGKKAAKKQTKRPTTRELVKRNYNQAQIDVYYENFDRYKIDENAQAIQKAKQAAYEAVDRSFPRPTNEQLKKRNYSKEQIAVYNENYGKYFAAKKSKSNNPILSSNNLELNEVATPPLVSNTSTEKWSVAFFASLLNETEEDHSFRSSSFDIFTDQEKTHSSYHNWQTIDTANSNTEELDLTFASLGETTEDNTFIPGPFDAITPTEKTDAVNQTAPLLFNYCVKTGSEHNPNFNLEETEDIFGIFDLLETDQSTTPRLA